MRKATCDFSVVLMLAAVASAVAQMVGTVVEIGRVVGWWQ